MAIILDGTNGISTPDLESAGPVSGTTASFSGNLTLGSSVLATPTGTAPSYLCRAWVNFNGTGTVAIRASGNVSSITDNGAGDYTVNFTTAMPDADYCALATSGTTQLRLITNNVFSTGSIRVINVISSSNVTDDQAAISVAVIR
jgi:hypothetical protein